MRKFIPVFSLLILFIYKVNAQNLDKNPAPHAEFVGEEEFDDKYPPNTYSSPSNPYYWKNRAPSASYWQQDVHYKINAVIDEVSNSIKAQETLVYTNNSPDTLNYVFFHLYQNAFQPNSYLDNLNKANGFNTKWGQAYEQSGQNTVVTSYSVNGVKLNTIVDYSVVKVMLYEPLYPHQSITIEIDFTSTWDKGEQRRRMKWFDVIGHKNENGYRHYDGVHWYPRICVYDAKFGWDTQQHLGKEFYGDYGVFDVSLEFSSNYVVEATGWLQNPEEALPAELRKKLDISNFASKKFNQEPSIITPYNSSSRKKWIFHAENVHDFAFTADPSYRIGEVFLGNTKIVAVAQESHAAGWQNAASYTAKVIDFYNKHVGQYAYPKMVVADAQDGMEYPMLTLDGGWDPNYRDLLAHEVGHNWFFGMVGNNETYRAMLDEGFTQFIEYNAVKAIDGKYRKEVPSKSPYVRKFKSIDTWQNSEVYNGYMQESILSDAATLNTHSDDFNGALGHNGGYRNVYFKTATMLCNLQYVLGDSLFWGAFHNYFDQWKICHPYVEDFRNSIIQYTKVDLNWFFDQWIETNKTIDYKVKYQSAKNNYYNINFTRKGEMQMPIDFTVVDRNNVKTNYYIPNTWFVKKTNATVLPKWTGWGKLNKKYTAKILVPSGIKAVYIDTTHVLADNNMLNNQTKNSVKFRFDSQINQPNNWEQYQLYCRPDVWFNNFDILKIGVNFNGNYLNAKHIFSASIWASPFVNNIYNSDGKRKIEKYSKDFSEIFNYNFDYKTTTYNFIKNSNIAIHSQFLEGLIINKLQLNLQLRNNNYAFINIKYMNRFNYNYLDSKLNWGRFLYPKSIYEAYNSSILTDLATINNRNASLNIGWQKNVAYKSGNMIISALQRFGNANYSDDTWSTYSSSQFKIINHNYIDKLEIHSRFFVQKNYGNTPNESALYLAGANPEEQADSKFYRSAGWLPYNWSNYGSSISHAQMGGGLNLRGYVGYYAYEGNQASLQNLQNQEFYQLLTYRSNNGASISIEADFDKYIKFKPYWFKNWLQVNLYAFTDMGTIAYATNSKEFFSRMAFYKPRVDAGLGTVFTIKKWGVLEKVKPVSIRVDFPFFVNRPPATDKYIAMRYVIGIGRSF